MQICSLLALVFILVPGVPVSAQPVVSQIRPGDARLLIHSASERSFLILRHADPATREMVSLALICRTQVNSGRPLQTVSTMSLQLESQCKPLFEANRRTLEEVERRARNLEDFIFYGSFATTLAGMGWAHLVSRTVGTGIASLGVVTMAGGIGANVLWSAEHMRDATAWLEAPSALPVEPLGDADFETLTGMLLTLQAEIARVRRPYFGGGTWDRLLGSPDSGFSAMGAP